MESILKGSNPAALTQEKLPWASKGVLEEQLKYGFSESKKEALSRNSHPCGETRLFERDSLGICSGSFLIMINNESLAFLHFIISFFLWVLSWLK